MYVPGLRVAGLRGGVTFVCLVGLMSSKPTGIVANLNAGLNYALILQLYYFSLNEFMERKIRYLQCEFAGFSSAGFI